MKTLIFCLLALACSTAAFCQDKPGQDKPVEVAPAAPVTAAIQAPDYVLGIDDIIDISVLQPEKIQLTCTVAPDGSITFPYIGKVFVKGFNCADVQSEIQAKLADGYMMYPVAVVSLRESRSRKFSVYGQVARPGSYFVEGDKLPLLKAISMAGGMTAQGSSGTVSVIRPQADGKIEKIDVKINSAMDSSKDIEIKAGDTLTVAEDKFFVYGEVMRPGPFSLEENITVVRALSMAGGFNQPGASGKVKILRPKSGNNEFEVVEVKINSAMNTVDKDPVLIKSGDTIMVNEDKFFVYGEVMRPGNYPLEDNTTVLKAVSMAGGFTKYGSSSKVKVLTPRQGKPGYNTRKVNVNDVMAGNPDADLVLESGDIIVVSEGVF